MTKELIVERIYDALKEAAKEERQITIRHGVAVAAAATNMSRGLAQHWLDTMCDLGWIHMDGITIWLSRDYGPRPYKLSEEEQAILEGQKVPKKQGPAAGSKPTEK